MDDAPTPTPDDDQLLERLAAAGPVLDDLYAQAAAVDDGAPALLPVPDGGHGLRRPSRRSRSPRSRGRAVVAAAVLLLAAVGSIVVWAGRDDHQNITTDQTTTTTEFEPSAELAALVDERVDGMETCGPVFTEDDWPREWPQGWKMVGAPDCWTGWVRADAEAVQPIAVVDDPQAEEPKQIAWWSPSTGWITLEEFDDPDFDLAEYRAAYEAELASRPTTTTTQTGD